MLFTTATPLTIIDQVIMLLDNHHHKCTVLGFNKFHQRLIAFFLFTWSVFCFYLEVFTVEFMVEKMEEVVYKTFINCWVLQLVIAGKLLCWIPTMNCVIYPDYTTTVHHPKRLVFWSWVYTPYRYPFLSVKEKLILLVLFLGNLIYYLRKK